MMALLQIHTPPHPPLPTNLHPSYANTHHYTVKMKWNLVTVLLTRVNIYSTTVPVHLTSSTYFLQNTTLTEPTKPIQICYEVE